MYGVAILTRMRSAERKQRAGIASSACWSCLLQTLAAFAQTVCNWRHASTLERVERWISLLHGRTRTSVGRAAVATGQARMDVRELQPCRRRARRRI